MVKIMFIKEMFVKNGSKWVLESSEEIKESQEFYNNILEDNNLGFSTRTTYGYSKFGRMSAKTFYSPNKETKSVYRFK